MRTPILTTWRKGILHTYDFTFTKFHTLEICNSALSVCPSRVPTCGLPLGVQGVDVHGEVQLVADDLLVLAGELVGAVDALGVPVGPVEAVLKHRDGKRVRQAWREGERQLRRSERRKQQTNDNRAGCSTK